MNYICDKTFDEERALYGSKSLTVRNCAFDGPADGESAFKESRDVQVEKCFFNLRYPFWHNDGVSITRSEMTPLCRAALWYDADVEIENSTLHGIKAPLTLLFFSNPGCNACMDIINVLKGEPAISDMIASGRLAVLNIYIDEDLQGWRDYMPVYPEEWYNGFDPDLVIRGETLYNVRAIPSLYLLDRDKTVIMKDAPETRIFDYLSRLQ